MLTRADLDRIAARYRVIKTSLGSVPAWHLCHDVALVDIHGPWSLARDRADAIKFANGRLTPPFGVEGGPPLDDAGVA